MGRHAEARGSIPAGPESFDAGWHRHAHDDRAGRLDQGHGRQGTLRRCAPDPVIPDALRRVGKVHHVALIVTSIEASLGLWRDALGLDLETVMDIPDDRVRIAFLGVGESKIELVEPTDDTTGVARFLASKGEGFHHVCFEVPNLAETLLRLEIDGIELIEFGAAAWRRGTGRLPAPALVPRRARRADRGARRPGLGLARLLTAAAAASAARLRQAGFVAISENISGSSPPCPAAGGTCRPRPRPGSRPSSRGTGARRAPSTRSPASISAVTISPRP